MVGLGFNLCHDMPQDPLGVDNKGYPVDTIKHPAHELLLSPDTITFGDGMILV